MMLAEVTCLLVFGVVVTLAQVVNFPRCNSKTLTMQFVYGKDGTVPYDLFATSRRSTCGKRAGTTTGSGSYADPYVISVDLSKGLINQSPDCGVFQAGPGQYSLTVSSAFSCEGATAQDTDYTISCSLTLPTSATTSNVTRSANYTCRAPGTIIFTYEQTSTTPPNDIYSAGKQTTCSKSAKSGTGTGATRSPYILEINVKDPLNLCGATALGSEKYAVLMYVQQLPDIITKTDVSYALTCDLALSSSQIINTLALPVGNVPVQGAAIQVQPTASLYVVSGTSTTALSTFAVGNPIRLAAQLVDGPATGLRVRNCTARPGPGLTPVLQILDQQGCTTGNGLVPPFVGQSPSGSQAFTGTFDAFKFSGYDSVYFQCVADFCYGDNDLTCLGIRCTTSGRRKREAKIFNTTEATISAYVFVRAEIASNLTDTPVSSTPHLGNSTPEGWNRNLIIVVASLGSICLVALLMAVVLGVKVMTLISQRSQNAAGFPGKTSFDHPVWHHRCQGERGLQY